MDAELLKAMGQTAGIGGLALGVFLLLFRDLIRRQIFPQLGKAHAYKLLRLIVLCIWSVALVGLGVWAWVETGGQAITGDTVKADCSAVNTGSVSGATINVNCPDPGRAD